ncbi:apolipoprotein N-acyltransferase [Bradyrhizobium sp. U87765 SZCCT0131]|uniref:apolipoprotein N-acyltransferase n=1 Tax=unclassified Bradyrhizobium TaxID=2631580 RepID=UPI001BA55B84|nr:MULTISPECIES: apolipoprotein N-acyltransferase [unclassified Bradyrhizobium]MBR1216669.1 apolipoprotein N-acyltransferase [Bradyrhizobium sp. U87765 SZCCT0131]MBR1259575.1 apolipoprotein N-acyltransferase [Bradyrhizobium sp. U87765 SZCCT0134]MBR1305716.1 apolipoprotein N-acyltransferase [Bradyrhizobium sp. U87765 SZCCT0110]MBR1322083.1 apolipoprotein N-acyltransferase [Bradyrhizobium sp. U87765 SZCCT0109]MBR1350639.1 apolipoprotein N-acyltransferase [Bradyrhizobium sp. U87765 SZCCT0048]
MTRLRKAALAVVLAWGWRRALIALLAGAVSALAMAPFNAWPVLFITFPVMVWLIDGAGAGKLGGVPAAAVAGWWFGFGYFLAGLYWIGYAFLVDADIFGWLLPFAVTAMPAGLALFTALGFALARLLWTRGASRIASLMVGLTISEWLRGHILTGFPWNAFGYALSEPLALAQTASLIGLWGLTFLAIGIFASPAVLIDARGPKPRWFEQWWTAPATALVVLAAMGAYGTLRLEHTPLRLVENVKLRLMQPNLQQDVKFNYSAKQAVMQKYLELSDRSTGPATTGVKDATVLIWPESAFPFFLTREADAMAEIAALLPKGTTLITGAVRPPEGPLRGPIRAYNSIFVIDHDGTILDIYDKLHLVPFGEYLPFQDAMEKLGFQQLTKLRGGYIPGQVRKTLELAHAPPVLPLICYEAIFPGAIVPPNDRPRWIVNVTNDGWFGISTGPYQHLQQARMRVIEEGLPLVRAANTGISAVIDPVGRIVARLGLGVEGVLDSALPSAIAAPPYARVGDLPAAIMVAFAAIWVIRRRRQTAAG